MKMGFKTYLAYRLARGFVVIITAPVWFPLMAIIVVVVAIIVVVGSWGVAFLEWLGGVKEDWRRKHESHQP